MMLQQQARWPRISIVMPVFNTGVVLLEAVRSVVDQSLCQGDDAASIELLVVDDGSDDPATLQALETIAAWPIVIVVPNRRSKGPAGARNTGIFEARGEWIGFLDSDDIFYPDFLRDQSRAIEQLVGATWVAGHFHVGDDQARPRRVPLAQRSPQLFKLVQSDYADGRTTRLRNPVSALLQCGCIGILTVRVKRDALLAIGGFDEALTSAEDYDLWLRLAISHDLDVTPLDAGVYRVHKSSVTHSGRPKYWNEDHMLQKVSRDPNFKAHRRAIRERLRSVYQHYCYHYRTQKDFASARLYAVKLMRVAPLALAGWQQWVAGMLRAG